MKWHNKEQEECSCFNFFCKPLSLYELSAEPYVHIFTDCSSYNFWRLKDASLETIKIADFGLSQFCRPGVSIKSDGSGTLSTAAPEILSMKGCNAGKDCGVWIYTFWLDFGW